MLILCWLCLTLWAAPAWAEALPPPPAAAGSLDTVRILLPQPQVTPSSSLPQVRVAPLQDGVVSSPTAPASENLTIRVGRQIERLPVEEGLGEEIVPVILKERSTGREITIIPGEGITISEPQSLLLPDPEALPPSPLQESLLYPLPRYYPITSPFGWRIHPIRGDQEFHQGTDLGAPTGVAVLAAYSGRVLAAGSMGGLGNGILIAHDPRTRTRYGHLERIKVSVGQWVQQGEVIGLVGSTGLTTGPHLHFELWAKQANQEWLPLDSTEKLLIAQEKLTLTS
jgi:murein DD-endopeptidase MepM/ murein hydrolase activator NlpD